jgi:predicted Fe-Mo cluster-binding NifX family protein
LITGNGPGEKAGMAMQHTGIECYVGAGDMTMKEAYDAFKNGELNKF